MGSRGGLLVADRYRLVRPLGRGGMGSVHLAHDERLDRPVALKRTFSGAPDSSVQRLLREAQVGASLDHPHLVRVYDVVRDDDEVVIAMELVEGPSLAEVLATRLPSQREAVTIVRQVASALDHAHARGVVHRDVKPANVLLGPHGAKLADLGISTAPDVTRITQAGDLVGSPSYMAPEQLTGEPVGPSADVHGLALTAYELFAGVPARTGGTPIEIAHRAVSEPPPDVRDAWPAAPPELAAVLRRALDRDPALRPASAGAFARELDAALEPRAAPVEDERPVVPPPRRRPVAPPGLPASSRRYGAIAAVVLLAAAAIVLGLVLWPDGDEQRQGDLAGATDARSSAGPASSAGQEGSTDASAEPSQPAASTPGEEAAAPAAATNDADGAVATVRDFYTAAAANDLDRAWALLSADGRAIFGSRSRFDGTFTTLQRIEFARLDPAVSGRTAQVALQTTAVHDDRVDQCSGSVGLVAAGDAWRISGFSVHCP